MLENLLEGRLNQKMLNEIWDAGNGKVKGSNSGNEMRCIGPSWGGKPDWS